MPSNSWELDLERRAPATERRAWVRYHCSPATTGRVFIANSYQSQLAQVLNLSLGGVGLLLAQRLEPGTLVQIELGDRFGDVLVEQPAAVVHATLQAADKWLVGCAFTHKLNVDELAVLLA